MPERSAVKEALLGDPLQYARRWFGTLQALFFPPSCLSCGAVLDELLHPVAICRACRATLVAAPPRQIHHHVLRRLSPAHLDDAWVAFNFGPVIRALIHAVKYEKMPNTGLHLGRLASQFLPAAIAPTPDTVLIPIPLHRARQAERGYNQSWWIARGLFGNAGGIFYQEALQRVRATHSQTHLNREERRRNVHEAFAVHNPDVVRARCVVLIDDVITTGATMNECARLLKRCGAQRVSGVALAAPMEGEL